MITANRIVILFFVLAVTTTAAYSQTKAPAFTIEGEVTTPLTLTAEALARFKTTELRAKDHDGTERTYKGVNLATLLDSAGVTLGAKLRGKNLRKYILIKAADAYEVIYSLPEVDPEFTNQTILLAYLVDGKPLAKGDGPFRIVAPADKKHARWIREVTTIKIVSSKE